MSQSSERKKSNWLKEETGDKCPWSLSSPYANCTYTVNHNLCMRCEYKGLTITKANGKLSVRCNYPGVGH